MKDGTREIHKMLVHCAKLGLRTGRTKSNHHYVYCPNGKVVFISGTPSDWRVPMKFRTKLRHNGVEVP